MNHPTFDSHGGGDGRTGGWVSPRSSPKVSTRDRMPLIHNPCSRGRQAGTFRTPLTHTLQTMHHLSVDARTGREKEVGLNFVVHG